MLPQARIWRWSCLIRDLNKVAALCAVAPSDQRTNKQQKATNKRRGVNHKHSSGKEIFSRGAWAKIQISISFIL